MSARVSRIPVPAGARGERYELQTMQRAPAPVGKAVHRPKRVHWADAFVDAIDHHGWTKKALDMVESHSFTGAPGQKRWCSRCTLMLPPDWKDVRKPVPPQCGDPSIRPAIAMYEYVDGNPLHGVRPANPDYAGARVRHG